MVPVNIPKGSIFITAGEAKAVTCGDKKTIAISARRAEPGIDKFCLSGNASVSFDHRRQRLTPHLRL